MTGAMQRRSERNPARASSVTSRKRNGGSAELIRLIKLIMRPETNNETTRCELLKLGVATLGLVPATLRAQADDTAVVPFAYRASDEALIDLRRRLEQTRWPEGGAGRGWEQRPPLTKLQSLIAYWRSNYDWRRCETELNRWSHFKTTVDGLGIHFIHVRSPHPNALPIILTHGWPSTVLLFRDVIAPLTDPTAHGGTAADAFDVVIPSLPGFAFSDKPSERGWNADRTARAWTRADAAPRLQPLRRAGWRLGLRS